MSTLIKPHNPLGSEPSRDDDPTGVRALLSGMAEPDPMPQDLVERINASLAAEQARRAAQPTGAPVTPLISTTRRRRTRLVLAMAGAAAAVTVVAVVGDNLFTADQPTATSGSAVMASTSGTDSAGAESAPKDAKAPAAAPTNPGSLAQIGQSGTRYTQVGFVAQAEALRRSTLQTTADPSAVGPATTTSGLTDCLSAIGAAGAQVIRADVAFYQGRPAVIIITTTSGVPMAYVVTPQCSRTQAAVLRPATSLP